jgi:putative intracellular protease/amidase
MPGAERLRDCDTLIELLSEQQSSGRYITAICAAPAVVLEAKGFLKGKKATAHPGFTDKLSDRRSSPVPPPTQRNNIKISPDSEGRQKSLLPG